MKNLTIIYKKGVFASIANLKTILSAGAYIIRGDYALDATHTLNPEENALLIVSTRKGQNGDEPGRKFRHSLVICSQGAFFDDVMVWSFEDGAITEEKLDTDLINVITSAVQPAELASAIATALASYVAKADIVSTTGSATDKVMSQHGVTEAIDGVTNKVTDLAEKVNGKQDALTLTVKDNGNIVISNIQGQSKEFMPATPSGDPMHYAYVAAGAEYNDTGVDIIKITPWADLADDDADKTVIHKAGYWYLNGLGDITTAQIRDIYNYTINFGISQSMGEALKSLYVRTNYFLYNRQGTSATDMYQTFYSSNIEVGKICSDYVQIISVNTLRYFATYNHQTKHFIGKFNLQNIISNSNIENAFRDCTSLKTINIYKLKLSISFSDTPMLTSKSVLYMINNEAATAPITITLHADVYNKCMANADILAALEAHPNISLASA